jgi:membrane dipeptidase
MDYGVAFDQDLRGKTHSDLKRWKEGAWMCNFFCFSDGEQPNPYDFAMRQMDSLDAAVKRNPDKIVK